MLAKWLRRLWRVALTTAVAPLLIPVEFYAAAWIGDATGWYRVEDYMCTIPEGCDESIAERKRLREMRTAATSNYDNGLGIRTLPEKGRGR
jgi:hypothetical protein